MQKNSKIVIDKLIIKKLWFQDFMNELNWRKHIKDVSLKVNKLNDIYCILLDNILIPTHYVKCTLH